MAEFSWSCWEISLCCCYSSIIVPPPHCHSNWYREKQFQSFLKAYLNYHTTGPPKPPPKNCAGKKKTLGRQHEFIRALKQKTNYIYISRHSSYCGTEMHFCFLWWLLNLECVIFIPLLDITCIWAIHMYNALILPSWVLAEIVLYILVNSDMNNQLVKMALI